MHSSAKHIVSIQVHFTSAKRNRYNMNDDYEAFCFYKSLFENADNFSVFSRKDYAGGTDNNGITDIVYSAKNGKKVYLSIDGGFPVPELAYSDMHTEDCSEEMIREIVIAVEQYCDIKISRQQFIPMSQDKTYHLDLFES